MNNDNRFKNKFLRNMYLGMIFAIYSLIAYGGIKAIIGSLKYVFSNINEFSNANITSNNMNAFVNKLLSLDESAKKVYSLIFIFCFIIMVLAGMIIPYIMIMKSEGIPEKYYYLLKADNYIMVILVICESVLYITINGLLPGLKGMTFVATMVVVFFINFIVLCLFNHILRYFFDINRNLAIIGNLLIFLMASLIMYFVIFPFIYILMIKYFIVIALILIASVVAIVIGEIITPEGLVLFWLFTHDRYK